LGKAPNVSSTGLTKVAYGSADSTGQRNTF
jgi:hypothetical protein